jgi:hypothetical protein
VLYPSFLNPGRRKHCGGHEGGRLKHGVGFSVTALDASQDGAVSPHTIVVIQPRSGRRVSVLFICKQPRAYHRIIGPDPFGILFLNFSNCGLCSEGHKENHQNSPVTLAREKHRQGVSTQHSYQVTSRQSHASFSSFVFQDRMAFLMCYTVVGTKKAAKSQMQSQDVGCNPSLLAAIPTLCHPNAHSTGQDILRKVRCLCFIRSLQRQLAHTGKSLLRAPKTSGRPHVHRC